MRGFTLLEVLLAMFLTALVAVLGYTSLTTAIRAAEGHGAQAGRLGEIQAAVSLLERDLRYAQARAITDERGEQQPALMGGEREDVLLALTRGGWHNPRGLLRSELLRVHYELEGDTLYRAQWTVLDRIEEEDGYSRLPLLNGVQSVSLRFLDGGVANAQTMELGGEWRDDWSPDTASGMPLAVEVTLEIDGFGTLQRLLDLAD